MPKVRSSLETENNENIQNYNVAQSISFHLRMVVGALE